MIFKPHLLDLILAGRKTQTRRPAYEGEVVCDVRGYSAAITWGTLDDDLSEFKEVITHNGRTRFKVDKSYAAQPGRGKPAPMVTALADGDFMIAHAYPARIVIDKIRYEDCRSISYEDAKAEGFDSPAEFLATWCSFYDPKALYLHDQIGKFTVFEIVEGWYPYQRNKYLNDWIKALIKRPDDLYRCWGLNIRPER